MISNDDDVPPLEDLSGYFAKKNSAKLSSSKAVESEAVSVKNQKIAHEKTTAKKVEFSGLKKGFFSSNPKPKPAEKTTTKSPSENTPDDDIPFIKFVPKTNEFLEIKEVRDKLSSQFDQTKSDWMTSDFLQKIDHSPTLKAAFQDPRFIQVSQQLAKDPVGTMKVVSKTMPQYVEALKEFMGLIGEAMEKKADLEDFKHHSLEDHEALVDRVLKDESVQVLHDVANKGRT